MAAFFALLFVEVKTYLAANAISAAVRFAPLAAFLTLFFVEWLTSTVMGKAQMVVLLVSFGVTLLEFTGWMPTLKMPALPANPAAPKA